MNVLVTGAEGQLGRDVVEELVRNRYNCIGTVLNLDKLHQSDRCPGVEYAELNITQKKDVEKIFAQHVPEAVIHCAAWTAVDAAEDPDMYEKVFAINCTGTKNIAEECKARNCKMIYISTDYVFNGKGTKPWLPDCKDYQPLNVYGKTKLKGENIVANTLEKYFIVRTAWVFGEHGTNFVKTMLRLSENHESVRVVNDQIGMPTYTKDLAKLLVEMIGSEKYGYYHATNSGDYISWYEFACEIFRQSGKNTKVIPVSTEEYGMNKAMRPFNSRLDLKKIAENGFCPMPPWKDALHRYLIHTDASGN